jgi:tetratricopeptide (TPR) repeat protein
MSTSRTRILQVRPGPSRLGRRAVLAALAAALLFAGCEGEPARNAAPAGADGALDAGAAKISALVGLPGELDATAVSASGVKRKVREGDALAAGEALETGPRCEAIVALDGGTTVQVAGGGRVSLGKKGGGPDLALERGAIAIARPRGERPFAVRKGAQTVAIPVGRTALSLDERARLSDYERPLYAAGERRDAVAEGAQALRGIGTLTARMPGSGRSNEEALELESHDVRVVLRDGVAETRIEEAFVNRSGRTVEATYRFVLPSAASVTRLALDVNGRIEEGEVLERSRARRIFREIVEDSVRPRDPALLEWERGSAFTMKIYPIGPGETRRVFLSYMEPALLSPSGTVRYVYPLGGPAGAPTAGRFSIDVDMQSSNGIAWVATPLYPAAVKTSGDTARASFGADAFAPRLDFAVEYAVARKPAEVRAAVQTEPSGASYAMLLAAPGSAGSPGEPAAKRRLLAVVDTSYGTPQELRDLAEATVLELFAGLAEGDEIAALACDSGCRSLSQRFEPVGPHALDRVRDFLDANPPGGASDVTGALARAFAFADDGVATTVVYVGDGVPTAGETSPSRILDIATRAAPRNVRVSTIGVGPNVDALLLGALADSLGGTSYDLSLGERPERAARNVAGRLWSPGLSNVTVEWPRGVRAAYPARIGFLPDGAEAAVFAELDGEALEGSVVLRGTDAGGAAVERRFDVSARSQERAAGFVGKLYAKALIDHLELTGGPRQEIVDVSRRMRVASRETSWIVLENQRMYDRFEVQRTAAGEWGGEAAQFAEATADEKKAETAEDDEPMEALAALDDLGAGDDGNDGLGRSGGGGGAVGGAGGKAGLATAGSMPAATPAKKAKAESYASEDEGAERARDTVSKNTDAPAGQAVAAAKPDTSAGGIGTGYGYGYGPTIAADERPWPCRRQPEYDIRFAGPSAPSARDAQRVAAFEADVRANPLSRAAHKRYVGALSRLGRAQEALAAADAWRIADPLDPGALAAYADQLARGGDRSKALRAYASIAEIDPARAANHLRAARAFEALGAFDAAASHYRAAAGLDPKTRAASIVRYLTCLAAAGMRALFEIEAGAALGDPANGKIRGDLAALVGGARKGVLPVQAEAAARGELVAVLQANAGGEDVDLSIFDPAGRRISGLWTRNALATGLPGADGEALALQSLVNGSYRVVVSRAGGAAGRPVRGTVTVRVRGERRVFPFALTGAEEAVADVRYRKIDPPLCW